MTIQDLIVQPCGWDSSAPTTLRCNVFGQCSKWHQYSSCQYLFGSNPDIWNKTDKLLASPCPNLTIEFLTEQSAKSWERLGLTFASACHLEDTMFIEVLLDSLDLIRRNRAIHATVKSMCRSLHPLVCGDRNVDVSFSDPELPFSIFVSCPPLGAPNRIERLAENIIHEALHLQLSLFERVMPLVLANADETLVYSPWKGEARKMQGLIHGIYIFGNLRQFWENVEKKRSQNVEFCRARITTIESEMCGLVPIIDCNKLTAAGQSLVSGFLGPHGSKSSGANS